MSAVPRKSSLSPPAAAGGDVKPVFVRKRKNAVDLDFVKRKPRFPKLISSTKLMRDERSRTNMFYVLFFPLYIQFWRDNVCKLKEYQISLLAMLYCIHFGAIASELLFGEGNHNEELYMPIILLGVYAVLMGRVSDINLSAEAVEKPLVSSAVAPVQPSPPPEQAKKKKPDQQRIQRQRSASSSDFSDDSSQTSAEDDDAAASPRRRANKLSATSVVSVRRRSSLNQLKDALNMTEGVEPEQQTDDSFPTTPATITTQPPPSYTHQEEEVCDSVKFVQWSSVTGTAEKVLLTPQQIRSELEEKCEAQPTRAGFYYSLALWGALALALCPVAFRFWWYALHQQQQYDKLLFTLVVGANLRECFTTVSSSVSAFVMSWALLNHVAGAVDTFERRYLYAKYFSWLTSSRKAQRAGLPYFRLHKVEAIKAWLSLRSKRTELDKETIGPYKSSDVLAHFLFTSAIIVVGFVAFRAMQQFSIGTAAGNGVPSTLQDWLLLVWAVLLSAFVHRITTLATKSQERFSNTSVLLTEELNIHMHILRKPEKKEELQACNQMLKVAGSLIKELEGSKSKKGANGNNEAFVLDPLVYSIIRVVFLSALGALSSDLLGFRVRIWKI